LQAEYPTHGRRPDIHQAPTHGGYDRKTTRSTTVNTALHGAGRLKALRANHPSARGIHIATTTTRSHVDPPQSIPFPREDDKYAFRTRHHITPRIHSVNAQKKVRINSAAEIIPAHDVELATLATYEAAEKKSKRSSRKPMYLEIPDSNIHRATVVNEHPIRFSKELPPTREEL
jgi:hypothetical protein